MCRSAAEANELAENRDPDGPNLISPTATAPQQTTEHNDYPAPEQPADAYVVFAQHATGKLDDRWASTGWEERKGDYRWMVSLPIDGTENVASIG